MTFVSDMGSQNKSLAKTAIPEEVSAWQGQFCPADPTSHRPPQGMGQEGRKLGLFGLEAAAALGYLGGGDWGWGWDRSQARTGNSWLKSPFFPLRVTQHLRRAPGQLWDLQLWGCSGSPWTALSKLLQLQADLTEHEAGGDAAQGHLHCTVLQFNHILLLPCGQELTAQWVPNHGSILEVNFSSMTVFEVWMDSVSNTFWGRALQSSTLLYKKKKRYIFLSRLTLSSIAVVPGEGEWLLLILSLKSSLESLAHILALCKEKTQQDCISWQV